MSIEQMLWVEKYRPSTINECILPQSIKEQAMSMVASGKLVNLLLSGGPGTGKTTLAKAMCAEMGADFIVYNGSDGSLNLEELRENISEFAHTVSMNNNNVPKVVIIDEADGLDWRIQPALRNAMEKYSNGCRFILTCNYPEKIIDALHSRCSHIDYKFSGSESDDLVKQFARRTVEILKSEKVSFDIEALKLVILRYYPDNRRILNELQRYANVKGAIDDGILCELSVNIEDLFVAINAGNFDVTKQWLADYSTPTIFNMLYKEHEKYIDKSLSPLFILKIAEAQRFHSVVPNQELNVLCALTEYMAESS